MKVLYIGYYREPTIWGSQSATTVKMLSACNYEVVCRAVDLNTKGKTPPHILEYENKSLEGVTHCIQHVFDSHFVGTNIFDKNLHWPDALHIIDPNICKQNYPPVNIPQAKGYRFYSVCDGSSSVQLMNLTKAIDNLSFVKSYHDASYTIFTNNEQSVNEALKTLNGSRCNVPINITPISSVNTSLPHIHNWGHCFLKLVDSTSDYAFLEAECLGSDVEPSNENFSRWQENPITWETEGVKNGFLKALKAWDDQLEQIKKEMEN